MEIRAFMKKHSRVPLAEFNQASMVEEESKLDELEDKKEEAHEPVKINVKFKQ